MIGLVIYPIVDGYICIDNLGLIQKYLFKHDNNFEKNKLNNISGLGIHEMLMHNVLCNGFAKYSISTVILIYCSALIIYYFYKASVNVETEVGEFDKIPMSVKIKSMLIIYINREVF